MTAAGAGRFEMAADVARLETDDRHTLHAERGDGNLARLVGADGAVVVVEKRLKDLFRSKVRVAPDIVFAPAELIARKQMPPTSRRLIKFFDYRVGNV